MFFNELKEKIYSYEGVGYDASKIPFGELTGFINSSFQVSESAQGFFPQIMIECDSSESNSVATEYTSAITQFVDAENEKLDEMYGELYSDEEEDDDYPYEPDYYICSPKAATVGSKVYICAGGYCSLDNPESEIDPLVEPVKAALREISKKHPDAKISILMKYHEDFGYNYGNDFMWVKGNAKALAAKQLDWAMRNMEWKDSMDYERLLKFGFEMMDGLEKDWLAVFWEHVPKEDEQLRMRLTQQIQSK